MCLIHFLIYHIIITIFYLIYSPYLLSIVADIATEGVGLLASIENSRGRRCCRRVSVARREGGVCCSDISKFVSKSRSTLTWNINDNESFKHTYLSLDVFLFICYRYTFIVFVFVLMTRLANSRLTGMLLITLFGWKNPLDKSTTVCSVKLTYFRQRRHEYPERDDEGNLDPLELDVEDVVLGRVAVAAVGGVVVVPDWHGVLTHSFLMKQLPKICIRMEATFI